MLVLSHRGDRAGGTIPENTLEAFAHALTRGADGIETDVRVTADGRAVLHHDRLLPDGTPLSCVRFDDLARHASHAVPLLDDALSRFDVIWNLEIKTPAAATATIDAVKRWGESRRLLVTSFRHDVIAQVTAAAPVDCGLLIVHRPIEIDSMLSAWRAQPRVRTIIWDFEFVDPLLLSHAAEHGWRSFVYGMHTPGEHRLCEQWGAAGVITDHLDMVWPT